MQLARKAPARSNPDSAKLPPAPNSEKPLTVEQPKPALDVSPLTPDFSKGPVALQVASTGQMSATFRHAGFDLAQAVRTGNVPRIAIEKLPPDWVEKRMTAPERKALFFEMMLPLVLIANDEIMAERQRLLRLMADAEDAEGTSPGEEDQRWLRDTLAKYRFEAGKKAADPKNTVPSLPDRADILTRVDIVPPALALAQGAVESAWGRSRFARQGNAMFGQWTWQAGAGIVPNKRAAGKTHEVRAFPSLLASVQAYMRNLNTSRAYRELRAERAALRAANRTITGRALAGHLHRYSEEGEEYVAKIRQMIRVNGLDRFDRLGLTDLL